MQQWGVPVERMNGGRTPNATTAVARRPDLIRLSQTLATFTMVRKSTPNTHNLSGEDLAEVRARAFRCLEPARPALNDDAAEPKLLFTGQRTDAGRTLPPYYLVYFLLVDLLEFRNLGQFEKLAWSVPIYYQGKVFLVEHRKFGLGVFCVDPSAHEGLAADLVSRIWSACKAAEPYFRHRAAKAVTSGLLNIHNQHRALWGRYNFLRRRLQTARASHARENAKPPVSRELGANIWLRDVRRQMHAGEQVGWLTQSVIEAFFAWSEHTFVHYAVLAGSVLDGKELLALTQAEWRSKFKSAFSVTSPKWKNHYDALIRIREEHRNYVAHGAFGKDGRAFQFHSGAGATPLRIEMNGRQAGVTLLEHRVTEDEASIDAVDSFISTLKVDAKPQWLHVASGLPTILTFSRDGTYRAALSNARSMNAFIRHWTRIVDDAANMDW
jgi:hypothetical protein